MGVLLRPYDALDMPEKGLKRAESLLHRPELPLR
jgi:hypothetical protein